ncbi:MAG: hypothetical protein KAT90_10045 [Gammaproteobacteria bacterium]|nr:hypothetical protein [Gammaproteobacteria bacterium]
MSDHFEQTIAELQKKLQVQEAEVIKSKDMINRLCEFAGKPAIYADADLNTAPVITSIQTDEFYGQPLAKSVRNVLEMRKVSNLGPATVKEIYETLMHGGYRFETTNAQNAQRGLRISLAKNVAVFHKLPNGRFGLLSWYPGIKLKKTTTQTNNNEVNGAASAAEEIDNEGETSED